MVMTMVQVELRKMLGDWVNAGGDGVVWYGVAG